METTSEKKVLDGEAGDRLSFITFIIPQFADEYKMDRQEAYRYLKKYGGLDFIFEFWWTLHVDNPFWSVRAIHEACQRNGGQQ
ncbi:MAG: DUF3791 domain-containing protein [Tannerellaceae bacterium]|nr:DUF3791 domain-containing protein [Tannerellaceae bacterium]